LVDIGLVILEGDTPTVTVTDCEDYEPPDDYDGPQLPQGPPPGDCSYCWIIEASPDVGPPGPQGDPGPQGKCIGAEDPRASSLTIPVVTDITAEMVDCLITIVVMHGELTFNFSESGVLTSVSLDEGGEDEVTLDLCECCP
jgi:hypothetical protein